MSMSPTFLSTLSLHDALPISGLRRMASIAFAATTSGVVAIQVRTYLCFCCPASPSRSSSGESTKPGQSARSEEHTSELQSLRHLVCRLLLEKKKKKNTSTRQP